MAWRTVFWIAISWPLISLAYQAMVDEQITLGDLLGAGIAALASTIAAVGWIRNRLIRKYPFHMLFSREPFGTPNAEFTKKINLQVGVHKDICIKLTLREGRKLELIDLRFVQRRVHWKPLWWPFKYFDVSSSVVHVTQLTPSEYPVYSFAPESDKRGGMEVYFSKPPLVSEDGVVWLTATLIANAPFSGYLSFEQKRG